MGVSMNDNELIAWNVCRNGEVMHTCLKQSTAEYLRDWCDAIIRNEQMKNGWYWKEKIGYSEKEFLDFLNKTRHYVTETEIIVN